MNTERMVWGIALFGGSARHLCHENGSLRPQERSSGDDIPWISTTWLGSPPPDILSPAFTEQFNIVLGEGSHQVLKWVLNL
jgi:hypothetical protein